MRVTNIMMRNRYIKNYNNTMSTLDKLYNQSITFRKFDVTSEDVVGSTKALTIRDDMARSEVYKSNLEDAKGVLSSAEGALMKIHDLSMDVYDKLVYGINDPTGDNGRKVLAAEIRTLAYEMVKVANTDYAGKYVLGGSNNSKPPFEVSGDVLTFNGMNVNTNDPSTGKPFDRADLATAFPMNNEIFMDVGLGLKIDDNGRVDPASVMSISTSGIRAMGNGIDADGDPLNLYSLCLEIANTLEGKSSIGSGNATGSVQFANGTLTLDSPQKLDVTFQTGTEGAQWTAQGKLEITLTGGKSYTRQEIQNIIDNAGGDNANKSPVTVYSDNATMTMPNTAAGMSVSLERISSTGRFDHARAGDLIEKLKDAQSNLMLDVTELGDRTNFIDFNVKRFEDNILQLQEAQNITESVDPAAVAIDFKKQDYIYKTVLSMGTKLLQQSIFDFMR